MNDLNTALKIACEVHANQFDKAGEPYILHPLRIMNSLKDHGGRIIAILHDAFDDYPFNIGLLKTKGFNKRIVNAVDAITKRKNESYQDYIERLSFNDIAVRVKIEDLKDNMDLSRLKSVDEKDIERIKQYQNALTFLEQKGQTLVHQIFNELEI